MGHSRIIKSYLKGFYETFLAYAITELLFVGGKNTYLGNSDLLMLTLTNIFGNKFSHWKNLIFFERDLIVEGNYLKLGE
jgi:hypothetical protein